MFKKIKMSKVITGMCCMVLTFTTPVMTVYAQTAAPQEDGEWVIDDMVISDTDLSLKLIHSQSWRANGINSIVFNYDNHVDNIIIEPSTDDNIKFDEYNSVNDKTYAANTVLKDGILTVNQSISEPSGGHDSEARLFLPENYSGMVIAKDKGNIRISNLNGAATYDITNNSGVVSFMSVNAQKIKVNSPNSGVLTMRDVKAAVDIGVIGRITINGNTVIGGTIKGTEGTSSSTIVLNLDALSDNLDIQNKNGRVTVDFPTGSSFKIDVTAQNVSNSYPGDNFQSTHTTLKGSTGENPEYTLVSESGRFTLSARK